MGNPTAAYHQANRARLEEQGLNPRSDDDSVLGVAYVYCHAHCRPHTTGWCTVTLVEKTPLQADDFEAAADETRAMGFWIYGDPWACALCGATVNPREPGTLCPESREYGHRRGQD